MGLDMQRAAVTAQYRRTHKFRTGVGKMLVRLIWISGFLTVTLATLLSTQLFPALHSVFRSRPSFSELSKLQTKQGEFGVQSSSKLSWTRESTTPHLSRLAQNSQKT